MNEDVPHPDDLLPRCRLPHPDSRRPPGDGFAQARQVVYAPDLDRARRRYGRLSCVLDLRDGVQDGRRLRRQDRAPEDDFAPREKCVDIALAITVMRYATDQEPGTERA